MSRPDQPKRKGKYLYLLALSAVGVVYGDIGTSPLYALRECFHGPHAVPVTDENILGVLSLIFWSLILVVSIKYLIMILRVNNEGEGGILALMEVVLPAKKSRRRAVIMVMGFFGAALLYGDGVITPAISVLSAVEGLKIATPIFEPYIIPITVGILFGLFYFQKWGTGGVGKIFGPVMVVWFLTIAVLGGLSLVKNPEVLACVNPVHAYRFFHIVGFKGLYVLGAVFLVVTGGEALYADLGHFGAKPIRLSWFSLVLPCLLLNYFGQGALLLRETETTVNPFYHLCPDWMLYPMVVLATAATIIASQAVISGAFSLTFQAVQLGYLPRVKIEHTSKREPGQVFLPRLNWLLFAVTAILVLTFQTSSNLAAAYGVAVSTTMVITDLLLFVAIREKWKWPLIAAVTLSAFFLLVDMGYLTANLLKILAGGWLPLVIAGLVYLLMSTWVKGRRLVLHKIGETGTRLDDFVSSLKEKDYRRVEGTAIYLSANPDHLPHSLEHNLEHNKVLHERIITFTVKVKSVPFVKGDEKWTLNKLDDDFYQIIAHFGYFQNVDVRQVLRSVRDEEEELDLDLREVSYVIGRETLIPKEEIGLSLWRARLYAFMSSNAEDITKYFNLPVTKVFEIGQRINL